MNKKIPIAYFRQPKFFKNFVCIGEKCPTNCCHDWKIVWQTYEVEKLKSANCSDTLKDKIEKSFIYSDEYKNYSIAFDENGKCPMLLENGLCDLQRELGAEFLSYTCMEYPRKRIACGNIMLQTCQLSCCHVMEIICNDENSMELENLRSFNMNKTYMETTSDSNLDMLNYPQLNYRRELFEFFYEILSDKTHSIETSIVLCAMAAQKLDDFINKRKFDRIPEILDVLKPQLSDPIQIEMLENANSNISLKAGISAALLVFLKNSDIYQNLFENGIPSEEKWTEGMKKWNMAYADKKFVMRNIVLNLFISLKMPFRSSKYSLLDNFSYFAAELSIIKCLAAAVSLQFDNTEKMFEIAVSHIDRVFDHNDLAVGAIIELLHKFGITSPAYLMGIIK